MVSFKFLGKIMELKGLRVATLYASDGIINDGLILYVDNKIVKIGRYGNTEIPSSAIITDMRPYSATAGFIDIHVHGGAGSDFMDGTDEAFESITHWHARGGTTALLATTCAAPMNEITNTVQTAEGWKNKDNNGARVLGIHAEGPFFNLEMKGCHLPEYVRDPSNHEVEKFLECKNTIKHITIAPELKGAMEAIEAFSHNGISVSVAHSNADQNTLKAAIERGLQHVTHLYNAMSYYHKNGPYRISGVVETALTNDNLSVEIIADGLHVNTSRLTLALRSKGSENICLVTDAMRGAGMPDGLYSFGGHSGKRIFVKDHKAIMPEGNGFASSTVTMMECVKTLHKLTNIPLDKALSMGSLNPARILGIDKQKGAIKESLDADIVIFDDALSVINTIVEGRTIL